MKLLKSFILLLLAFDVQAFDVTEVDRGVTKFLAGWFEETCGDINYSFIYSIRVDAALELGFFQSTHPSEFNPPKLGTDVLTAIETDICGYKDGYLITFRPEENYKVIGYTSFNQPE